MPHESSNSDMIGAGLGVGLVLAAILWRPILIATIILLFVAAILVLTHRE